jgi:hypothetical protein
MEKYRFMCDTCDTPIMTQYDGKLVECDCGESFVDATEHYVRMGGPARMELEENDD